MSVTAMVVRPASRKRPGCCKAAVRAVAKDGQGAIRVLQVGMAAKLAARGGAITGRSALSRMARYTPQRPEQSTKETTMPTQHYVHLFTGPDNLSHFKDVEVELADRGAASFLSETMPATGINFRK